MMQFLKPLNYAWQGIKYCFRSEKNFRIELLLALIAFLFATVLNIAAIEWLVIPFVPH